MALVTPRPTLKNFLSFIAGVCALALAVIALRVPVDHLFWFRWKEAIWLAAGVAVASLLWQARLQSREDREREQREKARDEQAAITQRLTQRLYEEQVGPLDTKPASDAKGRYRTFGSASELNNRQISENDPQVYVEIQERRGESWAKTIFVLRNHSGGVARKVQIEPLKLLSGEALFDLVDTIAPHAAKEVPPQIERLNVFQKNNIGALLLRDWDTAGELKEEFVRPMRVAYADFAGRKFETTFNLVFHAVRYLIRDKHSTALPGHEKEIFEIRNTAVRPLA